MWQKPELIFICGCNGAGKSTLTYSTLIQKKGYFFIDPDRISKEHGLSPIEAGKKVSFLVNNLIDQKRPFIKESTLTSNFDFSVAEKAKNAGYITTLYYIGLQSAELAISRVHSRVRAGGHNVPADDIRRRYDRSVANLIKAINHFDSVIVLDNTSYTYEEVAYFQNGECILHCCTPFWFQKVAEELQLESQSPSPSPF